MSLFANKLQATHDRSNIGDEMAVLELKIFPADILRSPTDKVTDFDEALAKTAADMAETMYMENGIGLAANQVGLSMQMLVMDVPDEENPTASRLKTIINPEILESKGEVTWDEGCLSFPGLSVPVNRAETVVVRYFDAKGERHEEAMDGLEAICLQHEMDHLAGITFIDYLSPLKRKLALRELKKNLATP
ncbi:MAG: peptide deformylase [Myxococcota bacterium]|nr:peptide deformylase [Myxococcota bacterium]